MLSKVIQIENLNIIQMENLISYANIVRLGKKLISTIILIISASFKHMLKDLNNK